MNRIILFGLLAFVLTSCVESRPRSDKSIFNKGLKTRQFLEIEDEGVTDDDDGELRNFPFRTPKKVTNLYQIYNSVLNFVYKDDTHHYENLDETEEGYDPNAGDNNENTSDNPEVGGNNIDSTGYYNADNTENNGKSLRKNNVDSTGDDTSKEEMTSNSRGFKTNSAQSNIKNKQDRSNNNSNNSQAVKNISTGQINKKNNKNQVSIIKDKGNKKTQVIKISNGQVNNKKQDNKKNQEQNNRIRFGNSKNKEIEGNTDSGIDNNKPNIGKDKHKEEDRTENKQVV